MKRVAINGFGRIGRLTLRRLLNNDEIEVVAVNDLTDNKTLAHLFKFDSIHGPWDGTVDYSDNHLILNGKKINAYAERDPAKLPWAELDVDVVLECTGFFTTREKATWHLDAGAKKVILSAPTKSPDIPTIVMGINENSIDPAETIFSNASCTTNCLAPLVQTIHDHYGITGGFMTTTHAYTSTQNIQDGPHKDLRRARAAALNIVPTTTGAAKALALVIPSMEGKIVAKSIRVPVICGSLVELSIAVEKEVTVEQTNALFKELAEGKLKGILEYSTLPLVSQDIINNPHSCIYDSDFTKVQGKHLLQVMAWYDNEYGYSSRLADLADLI